MHTINLLKLLKFSIMIFSMTLFNFKIIKVKSRILKSLSRVEHFRTQSICSTKRKTTNSYKEMEEMENFC